jgi:hypothetical protein
MVILVVETVSGSSLVALMTTQDAHQDYINFQFTVFEVSRKLQARSIDTKKMVMLVFEDETTVIQKPCIRRSMSFEGQLFLYF